MPTDDVHETTRSGGASVDRGRARRRSRRVGGVGDRAAEARRARAERALGDRELRRGRRRCPPPSRPRRRASATPHSRCHRRPHRPRRPSCRARRARIASRTHGLPCPRARRPGGARDPRDDRRSDSELAAALAELGAEVATSSSTFADRAAADAAFAVAPSLDAVVHVCVDDAGLVPQPLVDTEPAAWDARGEALIRDAHLHPPGRPRPVRVHRHRAHRAGRPHDRVHRRR